MPEQAAYIYNAVRIRTWPIYLFLDETSLIRLSYAPCPVLNAHYQANLRLEL